MVSNTIRSSITEYEKRRKIADDESEAQMKRLELQVGAIDQQMTQMASQMQKVVVNELAASEARHHFRTAKQDTKIDRLESIVEKMANSIRDMLVNNNTRAKSSPSAHPSGSTLALHLNPDMDVGILLRHVQP
jgi:hypothetical protein